MNRLVAGLACRFLVFWRFVFSDTRTASSAAKNHTADSWGRPSGPTVASVATGASRRSTWDWGAMDVMSFLSAARGRRGQSTWRKRHRGNGLFTGTEVRLPRHRQVCTDPWRGPRGNWPPCPVGMATTGAPLSTSAQAPEGGAPRHLQGSAKQVDNASMATKSTTAEKGLAASFAASLVDLSFTSSLVRHS